MNAGVQTTPKIQKPSDRRSDQTKARIPVVYFLKVEQGEYRSVKIGYSADHEKRLATHRNGGLGPRPDVSEICVVKGNREDEQTLHRYFINHRKDGRVEEFEPHPDVLDYVRWLRDRHFVWVPEDKEGQPIPELELVDSAQWLPKEDRRKQQQFELFLPPDPMVFPPRVLTQDDFYTHEDIITAARKTLGEIDLDPASHPVANRVVKAKQIFTKCENGLQQQWWGRVWLNPPFSDWADWVPKILSELDSGRIEAMCVLAACRTITAQYFKPFKDRCNSICILNGRIPFWGGKATSSPDDGHVIFYIGKDAQLFKSAFADLGNIWEAK